MAYMGQDKKKQIHAALKGIIPKDWKWSLAVRHHSTIVLTVASCPHNVMSYFTWEQEGKSVEVNLYHIDTSLKNAPEDFRALIHKINAALNDGNFDKSDSMTDYFHVGWYTALYFGRWDKPFRNSSGAAARDDEDTAADTEQKRERTAIRRRRMR